MISLRTLSADSIVLLKSVSSASLFGTSVLMKVLVLGVPYDPALDIWSIGCTLFELYTGKILFPGRTNNQMLLLMMELKGRFNSKMIKKAKFGDVYFDEMGSFDSVERDRVTNTASTQPHPLSTLT
jgi:serine/threonine protein kinase